MPRLIALALYASLPACAFQAQFDAASIKPSPPLDARNGPIYVGSKGGPGTGDPGRYTCNWCTAAGLVSEAYDLADFRVIAAGRVPDDRYHIVATIPAGATRAQFREMLVKLLEDRFKLAVHRDTREMQTFQLTVASGGPKLTPHVDGAPPIKPARNRAPGVYYQVQNKTMTDFTRLIEGQIRKPVTDLTALTGAYDFDVWWTGDGMDADAVAGNSPTIYSAIQSLGLKLESRKGQVEVVIVDHVEKPSEN